MKTVNRLISLLIVACIVCCFSACGKKTEDESTTTTQETIIYYEPTVSQQYFEETQAQTVIATQQATETPTASPVTESPQTTQMPDTQAPPQTEAIPTTGVGKYTSNSLSVEQVVYYPNKILSENKAYPVVVWANGTMCSYDIYEGLLQKIAEGGYIVVANDEKMAADGTAQRASIDFIISENSNSSSVLYNKINTNKIGAAGHSQGGRSAVNAASADGRISCVYSLAGSNYKEEAEKLSVPALFVTGTSDMIVASDSWVKPAYDVCKGPAVYTSLNGGLHITCTTDPAKYSPYAIDWFDIWLKGDNSKKAVFRDGGKLSQDSAWVDFQCKGI